MNFWESYVIMFKNHALCNRPRFYITIIIQGTFRITKVYDADM